MPGDPLEVRVALGVDELDDPSALRAAVSAASGIPAAELPELVVRKRSIDARRGRVTFRLVVGEAPAQPEPVGRPRPARVGAGPHVVIVGGGPAGLFCSYELARMEIASTIVERGKTVQPRRRDLKALNQRGTVDADSNYCFGEGGAGTFSDGKLYTRSAKRGNVHDVLGVLVDNGAPADILVDARPHIGSNRLPKVVTAMRERLEAAGVAFRFGARVADLDVAGGAVRGVQLLGGEAVGADAVVLATGHSARDVYAMCARAGVALEAKPFALGVRIEHPQPLIDEIQYGASAGHPKLPAASYKLACEIDGRGVFSFCMCPGGFIVPASTEPGALVVNGMSLSRRDSPYANSGLVVAVDPADVAAAGYTGPLAGVELQRALEAAAFVAGGGDLRAPATRVTDFLAGRASSVVGDTSYQPGLLASDVASVLDSGGVALSARLRAGLERFGGRMRGYLTGDAVLVGVESRTSSPVRIPRDADTLESRGLARLYPCGEGAGYAGGIVSAALDGIRVARAIAAAMGR